MNWYEDYANIVAMVYWMVNEGFKPIDIARAVEKPWKWTPEYERGWKPEEII